eukprot:CAMPEP_0119121742 /NCGR_PEP_ID=MMETSP1310-20130426/2230_1 /TAXON_ID=464262 /ORGANISM="Genus nov. species nov., Strain RCC2339" /LENGTH=142 /DNA_ID=CAMNT_0007111319 /DNA_START=89 /DNA_END=513 /DNA_ORIENTATION=+
MASEESEELLRGPGRSVWTLEEDKVLFELVKRYGERKQWTIIAREFRLRFPNTLKGNSQCSQHWRRVLAPRISRRRQMAVVDSASLWRSPGGDGPESELGKLTTTGGNVVGGLGVKAPPPAEARTKKRRRSKSVQQPAGRAP